MGLKLLLGIPCSGYTRSPIMFVCPNPATVKLSRVQTWEKKDIHHMNTRNRQELCTNLINEATTACVKYKWITMGVLGPATPPCPLHTEVKKMHVAVPDLHELLIFIVWRTAVKVLLLRSFLAAVPWRWTYGANCASSQPIVKKKAARPSWLTATFELASRTKCRFPPDRLQGRLWE